LTDSPFPHKSQNLEIHDKKNFEGFHTHTKRNSQSVSLARIYLAKQNKDSEIEKGTGVLHA
jgi:hypothetical protein